MFTKTSTTSIVAVLFTLLGFALLGFIVATGKPADDTTRVQVITGVLGLMSLAGAYYFGAAKNRPANSTAGPTVENVEKMDVNNAPVDPKTGINDNQTGN